MTKTETNFPLPNLSFGTDAIQVLGQNADHLAQAFESHMLRNLAPDHNKKLRAFSAAEVAELLGVSPSHLRKLHWEGRIPEGIGLTHQRALPYGDEGSVVEEAMDVDAKGKPLRSLRKSYTGEEILEVRRALAKGARNPLQFLPGRTSTEPCMTIAVSAFKGGSGKTTSACMLAQRFALRGYRVLLIDMDPQASASTIMGLRRDFDLDEGDTIYDALRYKGRRPMSQVAMATYFPNLDLAASGSILQEFETETAEALMKKDPQPFYTRLATALESVKDRYDVIFIDCPPQLGFLTMTALSAANALVMPVIPNMIDVASLKQFLSMASSYLNSIHEATKGAKKFNFHFVRYLLSRYEASDGPQTQVAAFLRSVLPGLVMTNPILKSTAIADAGITSDTIYEISRSQMNRATLQRALESVNLVADELEQEIHRAWGRIA